MPRQSRIDCTVGNEPRRDYVVTYCDDLPERAEAVEYFQQFERGLFPAMNLPDCLDAMPFADAQRHLDQHPIQEQWSILTISDRDPVTDDDLSRLQHIPELRVLKIMTSKITDRGMEHLKWLTKIEWLILYSAQLTNDCLRHIINLKSLQSVDMQCACSVTRDAYMEAMNQLPNIRSDRYPPWDAETVARIQGTTTSA